jgi:hypothetical protein
MGDLQEHKNLAPMLVVPVAITHPTTLTIKKRYAGCDRWFYQTSMSPARQGM